MFQMILSLGKLADKALGAQQRAIAAVAAAVGMSVESITAEVEAGESVARHAPNGKARVGQHRLKTRAECSYGLLVLLTPAQTASHK